MESHPHQRPRVLGSTVARANTRERYSEVGYQELQSIEHNDGGLCWEDGSDMDPPSQSRAAVAFVVFVICSVMYGVMTYYRYCVLRLDQSKGGLLVLCERCQ